MSISVGPKIPIIVNAATGDLWGDPGRLFYRAIQALVQANVLNSALNTPPGSPSNGASYIVAAGGSGAWSGKDGQIAYWTTDDPNNPLGIWDFFVPLAGWLTYDQTAAAYKTYTGSFWATLTTGGGGGTPGSPNQSVQFNSSGSFAGNANLLWLNASNTLLLGGITTPTATQDILLAASTVYTGDTLHKNAFAINATQGVSIANTTASVTQYQGNFPVAGQATITATNTFVPGQTVTFSGLGNATWLNFDPNNPGFNYYTVVSAGSGSFVISGGTVIGTTVSDSGTAQLASSGIWQAVGGQLTFSGNANLQQQSAFINGNILYTGAGGYNGLLGSLLVVAATNPNASGADMVGYSATLENSGMLQNMAGLALNLEQQGGSVPTMEGIQITTSVFSGSCSGTLIGIEIEGASNISGPVQNNYGLFIGDQITAGSPTSNFTLTAAGNASSGQTVYTGTFPANFVPTGSIWTITGFSNAGNNGTFTYVSSTTTSLTLINAGGVAESASGTATTANNPNTWAIFVQGGASQFTGIAAAIVSKSSNYLATANDYTINCNATLTVTLPTTGLKLGQLFQIKNIGTGVVTIVSLVNIDFSTSYSLLTSGQSVTIQWDGTQFWVY